MLLDLNFKLRNLDGKEFNDPEVSKVLANAMVMASSKSNDALKMFSLAKKLHEEGSITIDLADLTLIKNFVKGHDAFPIIFAASILEKIENLKS